MKEIEKFIPLICGLKGTNITKQEEMFLRAYRPWGIILFERNCLSEVQIKNLTDSIKEIYGTEIPILIDQEGGRVSRLNFKGAFTFPSAKKLFDLRMSSYVSELENPVQIRNIRRIIARLKTAKTKLNKELVS